MSDDEIKTLINTVTNLNKSKKFASQQADGPLLTANASLRMNKMLKKKASLKNPEPKQPKLQRSVSVDSVTSK